MLSSTWICAFLFLWSGYQSAQLCYKLDIMSSVVSSTAVYGSTIKPHNVLSEFKLCRIQAVRQMCCCITCSMKNFKKPASSINLLLECEVCVYHSSIILSHYSDKRGGNDRLNPSSTRHISPWERERLTASHMALPLDETLATSRQINQSIHNLKTLTIYNRDGLSTLFSSSWAQCET